MTATTKIFVALSFIAGVFYACEAYLTFTHQGIGGPAILKSALVVAFFYYGMSRIGKARSEKAVPQSPEQG